MSIKKISFESATEALKSLPNSTLIMLYSISKYHEKYRFTQWVINELEFRGFNKDALNDVDKRFTEVYNMILTQEGL